MSLVASIIWAIIVLHQGIGRSFQLKLNIVSIVDKSSELSCLVKIFSILSSTASSPEFYFLVLKSEDLNVFTFSSNVRLVFPNISIQSKEWVAPNSFPDSIKNHGFNKAVIFSRFYIPNIFPDIDKYIYLDNDLIVTGDLSQLLLSPLIVRKDEFSQTKLIDNKYIDHVGKGKSIWRGAYKSKPINQAIAGFVFEKHSQYKMYYESNFNTKHPLVRKSMLYRGMDVFFNAGVAVIDARRWRSKNITSLAEEIITMNRKNELYDTQTVGDQGTFLLIFEGEIASLDARWNMRRLPKKTVHLLESGYTGIVHFAGVTHGDAQRLCYEPLRYEIFLKSVVPLYLSILLSFQSKYPVVKKYFNYCNVTNAVNTVVKKLELNHTSVVFNPGLGMFRWPPSELE